MYVYIYVCMRLSSISIFFSMYLSLYLVWILVLESSLYPEPNPSVLLLNWFDVRFVIIV